MIIVRVGCSSDLEFMISCQQKMAFETEKLELSEVTLRLGIQAVLADSSKGCYYVAEVDGQCIAMLLTTYEWSDWRNSKVLWIQSVYVAQAYRGRGVYKRMYHFIQNKVNGSSDFSGIRLYVDHHNVVAKEVYQKLGMNNQHYALFEWMK